MIRVFIADDHALVREGLKRIFARAPDIQVVGEAGDGDEVLRRFPDEDWDVLVLDLSLPGRSGFDVLKRVRAQNSRVRILILSMQAEDQVALRLLAAGADGYVSKGRSPEEIVDAVRKLATEGKYLTPRLAELLLSPGGRAERPHDVLSDRELEILMMLGKGKTPSEVAADLGVSASTVSTHVHRIKTKLGLKSLGDLVQYALKAGLVT